MHEHVNGLHIHALKHSRHIRLKELTNGAGPVLTGAPNGAGQYGPAHAKTKLLGCASWLELDRHPFVVIADKSLGILDAKEDERGVVRPLIVLAQVL